MIKLAKNNYAKMLVATTLLGASSVASAGYEIKISDEDTISFGGYIKIDGRYVDGDVAYRDFWIGTGAVLDESASQFRINANETRFNTKYVHGDLMGYIELDFLGGGGNQIVSNSANPRLRHAFIKYKGITAGQTWSTFMNTSAIPESADFAGATTGLVFIRQGQLRYTTGNFQFSVENPESWGGDPSNDNVPDVVARYNAKGDWGSVSVSGLARSLTTVSGENKSTFGASIAGRIQSIGKDDFRFQIHQGELGRYVGVAAAKDLVDEKVEDVTSYLAAYRHFWDENLRSTVLYGKIDADVSGAERSQWSVNLFNNITKQLAVGFEVGNFSMDEQNADSNYAQISLQYTL
ncbi:DcaP family trimeric outer membrane transporter [Psychrobium sp. 1_MG-2023]|uniref:DcaP family trimeric outer membrane transporter n=1 Tax=Psychrobium sp. 1_MG-2023 TaxID=3062624 RepID=UPI00269A230B|nr:DcaP family trimeric outer membrane transporter [Psychrobium sp. 1_MG-2023]MDP2560315.1 DcaP family trimeric outer membrane transporter [Psychrobium sp. 1_MG-2023]